VLGRVLGGVEVSLSWTADSGLIVVSVFERMMLLNEVFRLQSCVSLLVVLVLGIGLLGEKKGCVGVLVPCLAGCALQWFFSAGLPCIALLNCSAI
jgi:hypothetical protein